MCSSKTILALLFTYFLTYKSFCQDKKSIIGNWVCAKVEDATGGITTCPFGESNEYLLFNFTSKSLLISEAPFDRGLNMPYTTEGNEIEIFSEQLFNLPELNFKIVKINSDSLILNSNTKGKEYNYFFLNQRKFSINSKDSIFTIDCGLIILNETFINTSDKPQYTYKNFDYRILNNASTLVPCPIFKNASYFNLGSFLSINFKFPKSFQTEKLSDEIIIDLKISGKNPAEVKLIKGIDFELNSAVFQVMQQTSKNWVPIRLNKKIVPSILRFHIRLLQTVTK